MKNALMLFLSEIHLKDGKLVYTKYNTEKYGEVGCYQTNEASVKYLMRKLADSSEQIDHIFAFSTKKIKTKIKYISSENEQAEKIQRDIFWGNILDECPQLAGCISYIDYDEDCESKDIVQYVLKIADVMSTVLGRDTAKWKVFTDLTGGMRHAAVLMISVLHLLKYRGIEIGDVIYANYYSDDQSKNRIEDVSNIHKMFELVSSTDSCLNYATLGEIENYFAKIPDTDKSNELKSLLTALRDFSDAVKVCRTGKFESSLRNLSDSLEKFKAYDKKSAHEALFAQVLVALEKDYQGIMSKDRSRFDIIRWCIRKGYLQQAMTLFNEWVPHEVVSLKIYYPNPIYAEKIYSECINNNKGYKKFENAFIDDFYCTVSMLKNTVSAKYTGRRTILRKKFAGFRELMRNKGKGEFPENIDHEKIKQLISEIEKIDILVQQIKNKSLIWSDFETQHPSLAEYIKYKKYNSPQYKNMSVKDLFIKNLSCEMIYKFLAVEKDDYLYSFLGIVPQVKITEEQDDTERNSEESINKRWEKRWEQICKMLDKGIVLSAEDRDIVGSVIGAIFWIRKQRNQINHAYSGVEVANNSQLEERMMNTMDLIEKVSVGG